MTSRIFALVFLFLTGLPAGAWAANSKKEAADRFDRGVRLFNDGDNTGALLEFKRAHELSGDMAILLNVGLVYAELNRPVEAVEALDKVLKQPAGVPAPQLARAQQVRNEQAARIGLLLVSTNVPAQIEVDNLAVGRTPMAIPVKVASGIHLLTVVAAGHNPIRQELAIAGEQQVDVSLQLLPLQGALANLNVRAKIPGADILVDGKLVGRTPLPTSVSLPPGTHEVSLRRPGYQSISQSITLADGATGEVTVDARENPAELELVGGYVSLQIDQSDANVVIDGEPRPGYRNGLRLPAGIHRLLVTRQGFLPFERDLSVDRDLPRTIQIVLSPTEETRASVSRQRRNAWITMGAGALLGGAGAYLILRARDDQKAADQAYLEVKPLISAGGSCDSSSNPLSKEDLAMCQAKVDRVNGMQDDAKRLKWIGWGVAGVGGAALITGIVLRLMADEANTDVALTPRCLPYAFADAGGGGMGVLARF